MTDTQMVALEVILIYLMIRGAAATGSDFINLFKK